MIKPTARPLTRPGITLLEVLVSLAVFLFAFAAIGQLIRLASDLALQSQRKQLAVFKCESKLAEVASGFVPLSSQGDTPFDDDPDWQWSANCTTSQANGLWTVSVTVTPPQGGVRSPGVTLTRMILDPSAARGNTMDSPNAMSANNSSSGSSGSSSGSSSTSAGGS